MPDSPRTMLVVVHTGKENALRSARFVIERLITATGSRSASPKTRRPTCAAQA